MQKFHHFEANSTVLGDGESSDSPVPEILDAVKTPDYVRVFYTSTVARDEGQSCREMPGGFSVDMPVDSDIARGQQSNELFKGLNAVFLIETDPDPANLRDWLKFNVKNSGVEAVLLLRRTGPDQPKTDFQEYKKVLRSINGLKRFVLLDYSVPLGRIDQPAESERMLAPEAPGKAMLEPPSIDVWRAPIGQLGVYTATRFRFLGEARAVLHCTLADLVQTPNKKDTIFDLANSSDSYVKTTSRFAYPWKIKSEAAPEISDHTCVRFDSDAGASIWCADPKLDGHWRPFRASARPPLRLDTPINVWRCVATRHKHLKVSEMVPKSSLVAAPELIHAIKRTLKAKAVVPPPIETPVEEPKNDRVLIVTTMKDEGPFLLEWLAYHKSIGVTDFLVYTNDCSDGTDEMFDLLQRKGHLEHRQNPYREAGLKPQHAAYHDASESELAAKADWIICMDVDEYINIHVGEGRLPDLFEAVGDANVISLTWRLFGNAGIVDFEDKFITEQFFRCAPKFIRKPHQAWGFKTMFRNAGHYKKFGVHRPKGLRPEYVDHVKWVNGSGHPVPAKMLRTGWRSSTSNWGYGLASLNHYSLRSAESYLVKRFRGRVNHVDRDQGLNYWFRMNNNATDDRSILNKIPAAKAEFDRFMADTEIRDMHLRSVEAHKKRVASLMESADYKALFDEVTGERLKALSEMNHHFGSQTFEDGPDSIPLGFHINNARFEEETPVSPGDPMPPTKPHFSD